MHTGEQPKKKAKFSCPAAGWTEDDESEAMRHKDILFTHRMLKYILCIEDCDKPFWLRKEWKNHISDIHKGPRYHCSAKDCDKQLNSRSSKLNHISAKHSGLKYIW
jgi:hypothetical protein